MAHGAQAQLSDVPATICAHVDRTMLFWTLALFFGGSIVFRAIQDATEGSPLAVTLGLQVVVLAIAITTIVIVVRRRGGGD